MAVGRLGSISLDCDDPRALAAFWAALLGAEIAFESDAFVAIQTDRGWITAMQVADHRPPTWPGGSVPKQMHLDIAVDDLDVAEAEVLQLGAVSAGGDAEPERFRVFLDPAGHPFCLTTQIPE
jgi:catechol 2,3-dioxygenase-like lactoylglutathione lyase family enzyme